MLRIAGRLFKGWDFVINALLKALVLLCLVEGAYLMLMHIMVIWCCHYYGGDAPWLVG